MWHLRPTQGTGTHHTRLDGDVEGAVLQILAAKLVGSHSNGLHLGMRRRVAEGLGEVVGPCHNVVVTHHDGSDGHFALGQCLFCLGQCQTHIFLV